jgi:peptidoglycan/LPS O-acetylase OafA/YrhL
MIFQNHEIYKLTISDNFLTSVLLYSGALLISIIFIRNSQKATFLDRNITDQVRGLAILLVVIGHIGVHTLETIDNYIILGEYGVSIFFILSGFGLACSYRKKPLVLKEFISSRLSRVMVPYWVATVLILILDYLILEKNYSLKDIILTFSGINLSVATKHIDYVRWYITVLLIWYIVFYFYWKLFDHSRLPFYLIITAAPLFFLNYYFVPLGYAYLSFPCGVALGCYYEKVREVCSGVNKLKIFVAGLCMIIFPYLVQAYLFQKLEFFMPYIFIAFGKEMIWILFGAGVLLLASVLSWKGSSFLYFMGIYSYEIFLFHGVFMVRYDFILFRGPLTITFWPFLIFIITMCFLINRQLFTRIQSFINAKTIPVY